MMVVRSLVKNHYFHKYHLKVQKGLHNLTAILKQEFHHVYEFSFQRIIKQVVLQVKMVDQEVKSNLEESKIVQKHDRSKSFSRIK